MIQSVLRDRYLILSEIGRGGLSRVYLGKDKNGGGAVAVKVSEQSDEGALKAALNEAEILLRLDNPGVPGFVDYFEEDGRCFVVTECMPGSPVAAGSGLSSVYTGMQLLLILRYLHTLDRPVLHLDIKPGNVLLSPDGRVSLIDFGSAVRSGALSYIRSGTPGYCAPEQLLGKTLDERTDIYGWGMLMRYMLSGDEAGSLSAGGAVPGGLSGVSPEISGRLPEIIDRCTDRDPENRFVDVESLLCEMKKVCSSHEPFFAQGVWEYHSA